MFYQVLSEEWDLELNNQEPDLIIYSCWGFRHLTAKNKGDALYLYWTIENVAPDFNECDYAMSFMRDSVGGRNFYMPFLPGAQTAISLSDEEALQRKFACFLASQDSMGRGAALRRDFTQYLMEHYKHVDCPGKVLHNVDIEELPGRNSGDWHEGKLHMLSGYKFNVAFENTNTDGYITEKLIDPLSANSVPIYWGSEGNPAPFPKEAMICANDYPDFESLLARVREVDENDELYLAMLHANPLRDAQFKGLLYERMLAQKQFLLQVAEAAYARKKKGALQETDKCLKMLSLSESISRPRCPIAASQGNTLGFIAKSLTHLYFLRPKALRRNCPFAWFDSQE